MHANGVIDIEEVQSVAHNCFGSTGTCGAMFTASTMAASFEAMGIALLGSSSHPAVLPEDRLANRVEDFAKPTGGITALSPTKTEDYHQAVDTLFQMLQSGLRSHTILTRKAFENAITVVFALGGSTNFILHLLALAHEADVDLTLDDFNAIGAR